MRVTTQRFQVGCNCCEELLPCDPNVVVSDSGVSTQLTTLESDVNLFLSVQTIFSPTSGDCPQTGAGVFWLLYFQSVAGSLVTFRRHDESDGIEVEAKANRTGSGPVTYELRYLRVDNTITGKGYLLEKIGSQWYYDPARSCNDPTNCADIVATAFHSLRVFPSADLASKTFQTTFASCTDTTANTTYTFTNADLVSSGSYDGYIVDAQYTQNIAPLRFATLKVGTTIGGVPSLLAGGGTGAGCTYNTSGGSPPPDPRSGWSQAFPATPGSGATVTVTA